MNTILIRTGRFPSAWLLVVLLLSVPPAAQAAWWGAFRYEQIGWGEVTLTGYSGPGGVVTIPDTILDLPVVSIGSSAFSGCLRLTSVTIPNSVTSIEGSAFYRCTGLTNATLSNSVTNIGDAAFMECRSLASVTIPNSVTSIGGAAFAGCTGLTSVTIPNSVTSIGSWAFEGCTCLTSVTIPSSVTSIGRGPFAGCTGLTSIAVDPRSSDFISLEGVVFNNSETTLVQYPVGKSGSYAIPNSVTSIGDGAFDGCTGLTSVTIPNSVTSIGGWGFDGCTGLMSVTIPNGVTRIGIWAFLGCRNLAWAYFEGDAPSVDDADSQLSPFRSCDNLIVLYRAGTTGWGPTFAGRPTAEWVPLPPFAEWAISVGIIDQFPSASAEADDPDQDGLNNLAELQAGTSPIDGGSVLVIESQPRLNDLSESDKTPIKEAQHALYFQSVPGRAYVVQSTDQLGRGWKVKTVVTATTTQKRVVLDKPVTQAFYRILVVP